MKEEREEEQEKGEPIRVAEGDNKSYYMHCGQQYRLVEEYYKCIYTNAWRDNKNPMDNTEEWDPVINKGTPRKMIKFIDPNHFPCHMEYNKEHEVGHEQLCRYRKRRLYEYFSEGRLVSPEQHYLFEYDDHNQYEFKGSLWWIPKVGEDGTDKVYDCQDAFWRKDNVKAIESRLSTHAQRYFLEHAPKKNADGTHEYQRKCISDVPPLKIGDYFYKFNEPYPNNYSDAEWVEMKYDGKWYDARVQKERRLICGQDEYDVKYLSGPAKGEVCTIGPEKRTEKNLNPYKPYEDVRPFPNNCWKRTSNRLTRRDIILDCLGQTLEDLDLATKFIYCINNKYTSISLVFDGWKSRDRKFLNDYWPMNRHGGCARRQPREGDWFIWYRTDKHAFTRDEVIEEVKKNMLQWKGGKKWGTLEWGPESDKYGYKHRRRLTSAEVVLSKILDEIKHAGDAKFRSRQLPL